MRSDDCEPGVGGEMVLGLTCHARVNDYVRHVGCQYQRLNSSQVHVAMLDLRLSGFQAIDIAERDGDFGAAIGQVAPRQPDDNGRRADGKQPDPVEPLRTDCCARLGVARTVAVGGSIVFRGLSHSRSVTASHISRESNTDVASIVMITTAAKATSPGPECTAVRAPNCRTATSIATEKISMLDQRPMVSMVR